ncbi:MAG: hypothetical protein K0S65_1981, partial [Labilithrix sp.]|nr:hypothetical protein [Labilithrix sp.]
TILHGDGTTFRVLPSGTEEIFFSVWASAHDDVWITSGRVPRHSRALDDGGIAWDVTVGINWNEWAQNHGRISTIWGSGVDDVWMAGFPSSRFGDPGCFWTKMAVFGGDIAWQAALAQDRLGQGIQPGMRALWGMGRDYIWGVGDRGGAYLYKGPNEGLPGIWTQHHTQTGMELRAVWGTDFNDVWAVGQAGTIRHYTADATQSFQFVESPTTENLNAVWGSGPTDIWAVGDHGIALHYDGTTWKIVDVGLRREPLPNLHGLWGSGPDDVWIVGDDVMLRRTKDSRRQP